MCLLDVFFLFRINELCALLALIGKQKLAIRQGVRNKNLSGMRDVSEI